MMRTAAILLSLMLCSSAFAGERGVFTYIYRVAPGTYEDNAAHQLAKAASECGVTDFILEMEPADSASNAECLEALLEFMDNHGMRAEISRPSGRTYPSIEAEGHIATFLALTAGQVVMGGDPTLLSSVEWNVYRDWGYWLRRFFRRHPSLPEAAIKDGVFCRINASGGLVGVFRSGDILVPGLEDDAQYEIRRGPSGEVLGRMSGRTLAEKGFAVDLRGQTDGESQPTGDLYEISRL